MSFYETLQAATARERQHLIASPIIKDTFAGRIDRSRYLAFLGQAFQHVRHTVPLLMAAGARIGDSDPWLQRQIVHYIDEETGHEQWILNDIEAAGGDPEAARHAEPNVETGAMVAYAWDTVHRRNPIGLFGMVFVLEGTSVSLALDAAEHIKRALALPDRALTYLTSHGQLDQEHVGQLRNILDRLLLPEDQHDVIACARTVSWLYGEMFRGIDRGISARDELGEVA